MKYNKLILQLSCLLLVLSACDSNYESEQLGNEDNTALVKICLTNATTRAYLTSSSTGIIPTGIRWNEDEIVKLFVKQDEKIYDLGEWPLQDISSDGKVAFVEFKMIGQIDLSKPYDLYGLSQYFDTKVIKDTDGKDIVRGTFTSTERYEWAGGSQNWRKVPWCFETTVRQGIAIVEVRQLAAYEFINLRNATDDTHNTYLTKIEADDCWFYKTFNVQFPGTIVTGENEGFPEDEFRIHNGFQNTWSQTVACYSIYLPNGKRPTNVRFHFKIDKKEYVTPARSANIDILPGHAYHYWLVYDGNSVIYDKDHYGNESDSGVVINDINGEDL